MTETEFIELALRYIDGAASQSQVDRLGAAMLDQPEMRSLYRDLVQQTQLAHEWQTTADLVTSSIPNPEPTPKRRIAIFATAATAAAAAILLAFVHLLSPSNDDPRPAQDNPVAGADPLPDFFGPESNPSWSDIYRSPFDYPEFVWRSELQAGWPVSPAIDEFSDSGVPPTLVAATPSDFNRLLAPIALLPGGENFGSRLY